MAFVKYNCLKMLWIVKMNFDITSLSKRRQYLEEHSLKAVSAQQIEEAISKALSELLDHPHKVELKNIQYKQSYGHAELEITVSQDYSTKTETDSTADGEVQEPTEQRVDFLTWFFAAKRKKIVLGSQRDDTTGEIIVYLQDGSVSTFSKLINQYPYESLLD